MLGLSRSQDVPGLHPYVQQHVEGVNLQLNRGPAFAGGHGVGGIPVKGTLHSGDVVDLCLRGRPDSAGKRRFNQDILTLVC